MSEFYSMSEEQTYLPESDGPVHDEAILLADIIAKRYIPTDRAETEPQN